MLKRNALDLPMCCTTDREVIDVDDGIGDVEMVSDDDTSPEVEFVENVAMDVDEVEETAEKANEPFVSRRNGNLMMVDDANKKSSLFSNRPVRDVWGFEAYRKVLKSAENRTSKLKDRGFGDALKERCRALLRGLCSFLKQDEEPVEVRLIP